jgi:thiol-disulfide isomerase/thioredoxin
MKYWIHFFVVAILAIIVLVLSLSCSETESSPITWTECGGNVGDHACDFSLMDQTGAQWSLYDHYGSVIVLDFSAMWCGFCQKAGSVAQEIQDKHKDDSVVWVTILLQNNYGQPPSQNDLDEWAQAFDMSAPVLSGNTDIIDQSAETGFNVRSWPGFVVIDRDMTIAYELFGWNETQIKIWLEQLTALPTESSN